LKTAINNTFGNLTFNPDLFPVPAENRLSFCNDLNLSAIDNIRGDLIKVARIGSLVLIGLALLLIGLNCLAVWYKWRSMKGNFERTRQAWAFESPLNPTTKSSESEPQMDEHTRSFPSTPRNSTFSEKQTKFSGSKPQMSGHAESFSSTPSEKQTKFSGFKPQVDGHTFSSTPQNFTLSDEHAKFSGSEPQTNGHTRSFPSTPQNFTLSEKQAEFSGSEPQTNGHIRSFPFTAQNSTLGEKHANSSGSEPRPSTPQNFTLSEKQSSGPEPQMDAHTRFFPSPSRNFTPSGMHAESSRSEAQMDAHTRSFPSMSRNFTPNERHTKSSEPELQMDSFPSAPRNLAFGEEHGKSSGPEPQMDVRTRSFPSAPQNPFEEEHDKSSGSEPQMDARTRSFPSAPQNPFGEEHGKSSGSEPQMDVRTRSFPSAPQNTTLSDPALKHTESSGFEPQMNADTRFSPSAPQVTLNDHNLLRLLTDSHHPLITRFANFLAARTGMTPSQNIDMQWFFHYVFHPPALACFLIGFFGLLSVMIQLFLLGPLLSAARAGVEAVVSDFSDNIANSINQSMYNQSAAYANGINSKVDVVQSTINTALFGWINGSTTLLNTTINNFYTEVEHLVAGLFNGTILEDPALDFVQCLIGNKVDDIEEALTFLQNNIAVTIPRIADDVLVLSAQSINEATAPIASAAVGNGGSGSQGLIGGAIALYEDSLRAEALVFGIFMGIWGIVLCMGICVLLWRAHKRKRAVAAAKRQKADLDTGDKHVEPETFSPTDEKEDIWVN
jgi:hypothetical protein